MKSNVWRCPTITNQANALIVSTVGWEAYIIEWF